MSAPLRFLLLQIRNADDPMRLHEIEAFARSLPASRERIGVFDLLSKRLSRHDLRAADCVLLGGSGHYSATANAAWLDQALDSLRDLVAWRVPVFASCWGFQAMARAFGGLVVNDLERAEVGTHSLRLTDAGRDDPVFGPLGPTFLGQMGHEDIVDRLPDGSTLLASSDRVENQAYRFDGLPIYCTQFHPELNRLDLLNRLEAYPEYVRSIAGLSVEEFRSAVVDTPETAALLPRFLNHVFGD